MGDKEIEREELRSEDIDLVEAVVSPGFKLIGATPMSSRLRTLHGLPPSGWPARANETGFAQLPQGGAVCY